jgi:UDP-glucose:(heptosyl)LPS alpha-1,3-glucosyltransferase
MRIALAIATLFPGGGLQRDCVEVAKLIRSHGHQVVIYTSRAHEHSLANDIPIFLLQNAARTNHGRQRRFAADFLEETAGRYDLTVGFDKLLGLDVIYCADASMAYRVLNAPLLRLLPRYRTYVELEKASFAHGRQTKIILLSQNQNWEYQTAWRTESERILVIPPTLTLTRRQPGHRTNGSRESLRSSLGLLDSDWVWLTVGVQPETKGTDRAIKALTYFPDATLLIAGLSETSRVSVNLAARARRLGLSHRVKWLGHREDISDLMAAADLLVHPARYDTTGTVILEAVVNGLPVITTAACGYARHVDFAGAGIVVRQPFDFRLFRSALEQGRNPSTARAWSEAGAQYGKSPTLYQGRSRAAEAIIRIAHEKSGGADQAIADLGPADAATS